MEEWKLYDAEYRLMEIVWEKEPLSSTELYKACLPRLGWKKSTTYTVLRKLCERGFLKNEASLVTSLVKRRTCSAMKARRWWRSGSTAPCPGLWRPSWERGS